MEIKQCLKHLCFLGLDSTVRSLQAALFPPHITTTSSYFSNFLVKTHFEDDEEASKYQFRDSSSRDWFTNSKDVAFTLQPPRWPTECQVVEGMLAEIYYNFKVVSRCWKNE